MANTQTLTESLVFQLTMIKFKDLQGKRGQDHHIRGAEHMPQGEQQHKILVPVELAAAGFLLGNGLGV